MIDVAGGASRADPYCPFLRVDSDPFHRREVDYQAVVDTAETRDVVAAAANGDRQLALPAKIHGGDHVTDVGASRNEQRLLVDHGVVQLARPFVFGMIATDQWAAQCLSELCDGLVVHASAPEVLVG